MKAVFMKFLSKYMDYYFVLKSNFFFSKTMDAIGNMLTGRYWKHPMETCKLPDSCWSSVKCFVYFIPCHTSGV